MIGQAFLLALSTSYFAWFIERHENQVVYPFDSTYSTPKDAGETRLQEIRFDTEDGETLILWHAPAPGSRPTVVYLPGNAGTLAKRTDRFSTLIDKGFGLIAVSYRGSSGSSGRPSEDQLTEDAAAVAAKFAPENSILYGESLGAALAIKLGVAGVGRAVVLEAPFTSIPDVVAVQYPQEDLTNLFTQLWDSENTIQNLQQPLLILHGTEDRLVPIAQSERLIDAAGSASKRLVQVKGSGHQDVWMSEATRELFTFLSQPHAAIE